MKDGFKSILFVIFLVFFGSVHATEQDEESNVKFGFLNEKKNLLLNTHGLSPQQAKQFTNARCTNAGTIKIAFQRMQKKKAGDIGRDTDNNFDKMSGAVFRVTEPKKILSTKWDNYCFIFHDDFMRKYELLTPKPMGNIPLRQVTLQRIEKAKNREIDEAWFLAQLDADTGVAMVKFAAQGKNELMSFVLIQKNALYFDDHPAIAQGGSTWRLDDDGELDPKIINIVFGYKNGADFALGYAWPGTEGQNLFLVEFYKDKKSKKITEDYFYTLQ